MQSNFDSEIRKTSNALIIFSTEANLFLIELARSYFYAKRILPSGDDNFSCNSKMKISY